MISQNLSTLSPSTFQSTSPYSVFTPDLKDLLTTTCQNSPTRRARINFHTGPCDWVQEMVICMHISSSVPVHRHFNKSESFHLIDGSLAVILFKDKSMDALDTIILSSDSGIAPCFYRLNTSLYHLVVPLTEYVFFHETTTGPFSRSKDDVPSIWSSAEGINFAAGLRGNLIEQFSST